MKYRKNLLYNKEYQKKVKEIISEIAERYWYIIHKLGTDGDHVHIFLQAAPDDSVSRIVQTIKSITTREMFKTFPELKRLMWGARLWEQGFFARSVGDETTSEMIKKYIEKQDQQRGINSDQLTFF